MEDNNGLPPISLEVIEPQCFRSSVQQMLLNETGRCFRNDITDLELCGLIDNDYLPKLRKSSVYEMSGSERNALGNIIYSDFRTGKISALLGRNAGFPDKNQIARCAVII